MKRRKIAFILLMVIVYSGILIAQQQNQFVIGAYMHNTPWPRDSYFAFHDSSLFSLWRARALGINTAMVYVRQPDRDYDINYAGPYQNTLLTNMDSLRNNFQKTIAMNEFASYIVLDGAATEYIRNFDYVFFYSGAYYSKWDATQEIVPLGTLGLKHDHGFRKTIGNKVYWSTHDQEGNPPEDLEGEPLFVKGPNYLQETRYRSSCTDNPWDNDLQTYEVNFHLKLGDEPIPEELDDPVCQILVYVKYRLDGNILQQPLILRELTAGEVWQNQDGIKMWYDYADFCQNAFKITDAVPCAEGGKELIDVEFRVKYYDTGHELLIDHIEVYDFDIWWRRLYYEEGKNQARGKISNYLIKFRNANPQFYQNNFKYFFGVDEPHSVDCYIPHAFVQGVLDSLNYAWSEGAPLLFTHFYPAWNGFRDNARTIPPFVNIVKPKPFHFYYAPYYYDPDVPTEQGLENLRNIFYWVYDGIKRADGLMDDFYITLEVWDQGPGHWLKWRSPTPEELNAGVMLSLAHGAKGIFYEPFYSYGDSENTVYGLLEREYPYNPKPIGIHLRDNLHPRLNGILGNTLLKLKYTGKEICFRSLLDPDVTCTYADSSYDYLTLYGLPENECDFNAAFLKDTLDQDNKYFMVVNSFCTDSRDLRMELNLSNSGYNNLKVKNVEGGLDTTFNGSNSYFFDYNFPPGEGYLFQVAPVVKYGGKLLFNETISSTVDLADNLIIYQNATLTITGTYNLYDTLIINQGGYLVVSSGGKINVCEGGKIINNGNIITENAEIKFADGISLRNNGNLNASYTLFSALSNNWDGIYFSNGSSGTINYCTVEKSSGALLTLNNSSPDIKNSSLHDCVNGIDVLNGSSAFIYRDTIYNFTVNGVYIDNSAPFLALNIITGDQNHDPSVSVKCENYATPYFSNLEECNGRNTLQNGTTGVTANNYSSVYMGTEAEYYHLNRIINNSYYASADSNSVIYAQLNWWGTSDPNKDLFLTGYESFVYYEPYLTEDPQEGFLMGGENNYSFLDQQLIEAKRLTIDSNYTGASNIYRSMIINNPDSAQSGIALIELKEILRKTDDNTQLNYITLLSDSTNNHPLRKRALESLSGIFLRKKNYLSAQAINNYLIQSYPNTEYERSGRSNKFYTHFAKSEFTQAKEELDIIKSKYVTDDQIQAMDWLLYLEGYNPILLNKTNKSIAAAKTVINKFSSQNYPNPFNPSTTIRFYIEQRGKVNLTIYDILGRRVSTLVDELKDPGEYEVKFDGTKYASGVYIYSIQSNDQVLTRKFILMK